MEERCSHWVRSYGGGPSHLYNENIKCKISFVVRGIYRQKLCCCRCCWVASVVSDPVQPHRRQPTRLPVPGILQARTLEWAAVAFSNAGKWKVKVKSLRHVRNCANSYQHHSCPPLEFPSIVHKYTGDTKKYLTNPRAETSTNQNRYSDQSEWTSAIKTHKGSTSLYQPNMFFIFVCWCSLSHPNQCWTLK